MRHTAVPDSFLRMYFSTVILYLHTYEVSPLPRPKYSHRIVPKDPDRLSPCTTARSTCHDLCVTDGKYGGIISQCVCQRLKQQSVSRPHIFQTNTLADFSSSIATR